MQIKTSQDLKAMAAKVEAIDDMLKALGRPTYTELAQAANELACNPESFTARMNLNELLDQTITANGAP